MKVDTLNFTITCTVQEFEELYKKGYFGNTSTAPWGEAIAKEEANIPTTNIPHKHCNMLNENKNLIDLSNNSSKSIAASTDFASFVDKML